MMWEREKRKMKRGREVGEEIKLGRRCERGGRHQVGMLMDVCFPVSVNEEEETVWVRWVLCDLGEAIMGVKGEDTTSSSPPSPHSPLH